VCGVLASIGIVENLRAKIPSIGACIGEESFGRKSRRKAHFEFCASYTREGDRTKEEGVLQVKALFAEVAQAEHDSFGLMEGIFILEFAIACERQASFVNSMNIRQLDAFVLDDENADSRMQEN